MKALYTKHMDDHTPSILVSRNETIKLMNLVCSSIGHWPSGSKLHHCKYRNATVNTHERTVALSFPMLYVVKVTVMDGDTILAIYLSSAIRLCLLSARDTFCLLGFDPVVFWSSLTLLLCPLFVCVLT